VVPVFFALVLAAQPVRAAPAPVAPKSAKLVLYVASPKTGLPDLRSFLGQAGTRAPSLRPESLGRSLGSPLGADLLDPASLESVGIDATSPLTVSFSRQGSLTCFRIADAEALTRASNAMAGAGQPVQEKHKGATLSGAAVRNVWRVGLLVKGKAGCFAVGEPDALPLLKDGVTALGGGGIAKAFAAATAGMTAGILGYLKTPQASGAFEVVPTEKTLLARGHAQAGKLSLEPPADADPLARFTVEAPVVATATLSRQLLADPAGPAGTALSFLVHGACRACGPEVVPQGLAALQKHLSGSLAVVVTRVDPSAAGAPFAQYFLFPHAYLLALSNPAGAKDALISLAESMKGRGAELTTVPGPGEGLHHKVTLGTRPVFFGVSGRLLYVANDLAARDTSLGAASSFEPGKAAHAAQARLDGPRAAKALRRVNLLDIGKMAELAMLFAAGVEAGPLLAGSKDVSVWADPDKAGTRFEAVVELE